MNEQIIELPSGRMISIHDIIYVGNIKNRPDTLFENNQYGFDVLWANGQKISINFSNYEQCKIDWLDLKKVIKNHTSQMICEIYEP